MGLAAKRGSGGEGRAMSKLSDVMSYICQHYPHKDELSKARIAKIIYLADWRYALKEGKQITDVEWKFNHYGPYVDDVMEEAIRDPKKFKIVDTHNFYGDPKQVIKIRKKNDHDLSDDEVEALDFIIGKTKKMYWKQFIDLVYSTYPILTRERQDILDLPKLAREYRSKKRKPQNT